MKTRLLAMVLAVVMVLAAVPMPASAASITEDEVVRKLNEAAKDPQYSGKYDGKYECIGFAMKLFKYIFGVEIPANYSKLDSYAQKETFVKIVGTQLGKGYSADALRNLLSQAKPGDIFVAGPPTDGRHQSPHVVIIREVVKTNGVVTSIKVYDANGNWNGKDYNKIATNQEWFVTTSRGKGIQQDRNTSAKLYRYVDYADGSGTSPAKTFTVTFDPNGGTGSKTTKTYTYESGEKLGVLPATSRTGYTLSCWSTAGPNESTGLVVSSDTPVEWLIPSSGKNEVTLYAQWNSNQYILNYDANGGFVSISSKEIYYGSNYGGIRGDLPVPTREGYTFDGWYTSANGGSRVTNDTKVTTTGNRTLYAHWTQVPVIPDPPEPDCGNGHTWGGWKIVKEANCENDGKRRRICSVCGEREEERVAALGHDYRLTSSTATEETYTCSRCGNSYKKPIDSSDFEIDGGEACQHQWSDWNVYEYCDMEGWKSRYCKKCGEREEEPLPATGHDWRLERDGYYRCTQCDATDYTRHPATHTAGMENFQRAQDFYSWLFDDVSSNAWYENNVRTAYELGLMKGTGSGTFSPGNNVTLAEAITLAARIHSIYHTGSDDFASYDGGNWYDPYVDYAGENGIVNTYYNYTRPATREEFVHILAKALPEYELESTNEDFFLADFGSITYFSDVWLLGRAGVINGINEGDRICFKPLNPITRAEVAAVIGRMVMPDTRVSATIVTPAETVVRREETDEEDAAKRALENPFWFLDASDNRDAQDLIQKATDELLSVTPEALRDDEDSVYDKVAAAEGYCRTLHARGYISDSQLGDMFVMINLHLYFKIKLVSPSMFMVYSPDLYKEAADLGSETGKNLWEGIQPLL